MIISFLKYLLNEKRYSEHTVRSYQGDLAQLEEFLLHTDDTFTLETATHKLLRAWVVSLIEQQVSPRSVNRKIASLRSFYKFLQKKRDYSREPNGQA